MTSLIPWLDAAYAPTPAEAQQAFTEGYRECGYYLPNIPNSDPLNTWNANQVATLRQAGLKPVPIVVPKPDLSGDPVATADAAYAQAKAFGHFPKTAILYDGPHLVNTGKITGPVWLPLPGNPPSAIGAGSAIQWGQENIAGWSVDRDSAAPDFPADAGIVCDFEHAILGYRTVDEAVAWYQAFQNRIAELAAADHSAPIPAPQPAPQPQPPSPAPQPAPAPTPQPPKEINVNVPVLSVTNPGVKNFSSAVRNLQTLLIAHGFSCGSAGADGHFGPATAAAVVAAEHHFGLSVDTGEAGNQVWTALCTR